MSKQRSSCGQGVGLHDHHHAFAPRCPHLGASLLFFLPRLSLLGGWEFLPAVNLERFLSAPVGGVLHAWPFMGRQVFTWLRGRASHRLYDLEKTSASLWASVS